MTTAVETPTSFDLTEFEDDFDEPDLIHITTCFSTNWSLCRIDLSDAVWADSLDDGVMCKECLKRVDEKCSPHCRKRH
jgi:hypothetical protein